MKKRCLDRLLKSAGYSLVRSNGHEIWSNGTRNISVPNAKDVRSGTVNQLLRSIAYAEDVPEVSYRAKIVAPAISSTVSPMVTVEIASK